MWRLLTFLIIGFWAGMTGLLAKRLLFPAERGAAVEVADTFESFFAGDERFTQIVVYQNNKEIGQGSISKKEAKREGQPSEMRAVGLAELQEADSDNPVPVRWNVNLLLQDNRELHGFDAFMNMGNGLMEVELNVDSEGKPDFKVTRGGKVVADSKSPAFAFLTKGLLAQARQKAEKQNIDEVMTAWEEFEDLAGRQRKVRVVQISPTKDISFQLRLTEMGEFVRAELPNGYEFRSAVYDKATLEDIDQDEFLAPLESTP